MATIETDIETALFMHVANLDLGGLPIAWPNQSFDPLPRYLRVAHFPNRNRRFLIGSSEPHQRIGLLHLTVFGPKNAGPTETGEVAGQVAAHFPADLQLPVGQIPLRITAAPDVGPAQADDTHWLVPVRVSYEIYA
jgi:hypothetical protein